MTTIWGCFLCKASDIGLTCFPFRNLDNECADNNVFKINRNAIPSSGVSHVQLSGTNILNLILF